MSTSYYPAFETILIASNGTRSTASVTLNVTNITAGGSLGTVASDSNGMVAKGSFSVAAGTIVEFSHGTYPGKLRFTTQSTQTLAYTVFENASRALVLQNSQTPRDSTFARIYLDDGVNAPYEIGSGTSGTSLTIPFSSPIAKDVNLRPVSYRARTSAQMSSSVYTATATAVSIPGANAVDSVTAEATETIGGSVVAVNLFSSGGALKLQKADSSDPTKPCNAHIRAAGHGRTAGTSIEAFVLFGSILIDEAAPFTAGATYYLGTGGLLSTSPGTNPQLIGYARSTSEVIWEPRPMTATATEIATGTDKNLMVTPAAFAGWGPLRSSNNLSDLLSPGTARSNLGASSVGDDLFTAASVAYVQGVLGITAPFTTTSNSSSSFNLSASDSGKRILGTNAGGPNVALPASAGCTADVTRFQLMSTANSFNLIPDGSDVIQCVHYGASGNFSTLSSVSSNATASFRQYMLVEVWYIGSGTWVVTNGAMSFT